VKKSIKDKSLGTRETPSQILSSIVHNIPS